MKAWWTLGLAAVVAMVVAGCESLSEVQKAERDLEAALADMAMVNSDRARVVTETALLPNSSPATINLRHQAVMLELKLAMAQKQVTVADENFAKARAAESSIPSPPETPDTTGTGNVPTPPTIPAPDGNTPPPVPNPVTPPPTPVTPPPTPVTPPPTPVTPPPTPVTPPPTPVPPTPNPTVPPGLDNKGQPTPSPTTPAGLPGKPAVPGLELSPLQVKLNNDCGFEFSYVESELKNITTATFIDIKLVFQLYDKDDKKVDTATLNEKTLAPGGTLKFTAGADAITNAGVRAELIEIKASQQ